jgi:diacylglycerol kinase (ATP)
MKHIFIINVHAGKRDQASRILTMAEKLRVKYGLDCSCMITDHPGGAEELARRAASGNDSVRIYACGGDGTASEVANGIAGFENAAMTCIPSGTGNDLLRNFGADAVKFRDAENLWDGPQFPLDLIECNGRYALTIACTGIDARVADDVHKYRANPLFGGKSSYLTSLLMNFLFKDIHQRWTVSLDGQVLLGDYCLISVCNGRYYGGGFMPVPEARMNDGVLDTIIVKGVSKLSFARFVSAYAKGEWRRFPSLIRVVHPQEIRIQSSNCELVTCLDGESLHSSDVTIRLADKKVNFFGPAGCDCNRTAR